MATTVQEGLLHSTGKEQGPHSLTLTRSLSLTWCPLPWPSGRVGLSYLCLDFCVARGAEPVVPTEQNTEKDEAW